MSSNNIAITIFNWKSGATLIETEKSIFYLIQFNFFFPLKSAVVIQIFIKFIFIYFIIRKIIKIVTFNINYISNLDYLYKLH